MSEHEYHFEVKMACSSCSGAVERVLSRLEGVTSYNVNLEKQTVDVKGTVDYDTVLEKIKKTGKQVLAGSVVA
ncbi:Cytosolic copper metallochaperone [Malassezia cuniculi]|uniref:Cytosolic copper metallochaperone n=1 Tax=Malassezia cuniculi TaxID=948313 RepID=A0AAF0J7P2_9BASI|nr:Cytosolic copper metallochaperone [Malassezia cuniculi]